MSMCSGVSSRTYWWVKSEKRKGKILYSTFSDNVVVSPFSCPIRGNIPAKLRAVYLATLYPLPWTIGNPQLNERMNE